jgi:hypothetical protein
MMEQGVKIVTVILGNNESYFIIITILKRFEEL